MVKAIVLGAIAGWLAIDLYLSIADSFQGITPLVLFQWDASNALGRAAFSGGYPAGILGLVMDLGVSLVWAAIYCGLMSRSAWLQKRTLLPGALFGVVVMAVMIGLIVPLGHASKPHFHVWSFLNTLFAHTAFFGVPLAWAARRSYTGG